MEARVDRKFLLLCVGLVMLIRLPFLNQAIQGDDHIYLTEAQHALVDPLHPNDVKYVFLGDEVDLRGHPHPPGNAWPLAGLLLLFGDVKEIPFHAAYMVFSLIAVWAMWSLAYRFSERPLWATLLFIAVPAFVVNGRSLEADLPFLAFWMASIALFLSGRLWLAALAMAAAAMLAYQAALLVPVLYCGIRLRLVQWDRPPGLSGWAFPPAKLHERLDAVGGACFSLPAGRKAGLTTCGFSTPVNLLPLGVSQTTKSDGPSHPDTI